MINRRVFSMECLWAWLGRGAGHVKSPDPLYRQIKEYLDSIPVIDTHDHLRPFDRLQGYVQTERGLGMNLFGLINTSYYPRIKPVVRQNLIRDETWRDSSSPQLKKRA